MAKVLKIEKKKSKILLMGLDNAGKTSIVLSLDKLTNLMTFYSVKPTKGVQVKSLENISDIISIWDFGGQEQYRKDHLENFQKYISEADKLIYVIDVQDLKRYDEVIEFFKSIIEKIKKLSTILEINIFFHKHDPGIEEILPKLENIEIPKLKEKCYSLIPEGFKKECFKTTIFTVFQKDPC